MNEKSTINNLHTDIFTNIFIYLEYENVEQLRYINKFFDNIVLYYITYDFSTNPDFNQLTKIFDISPNNIKSNYFNNIKQIALAIMYIRRCTTKYFIEYLNNTLNKLITNKDMYENACLYKFIKSVRNNIDKILKKCDPMIVSNFTAYKCIYGLYGRYTFGQKWLQNQEYVSTCLLHNQYGITISSIMNCIEQDFNDQEIIKKCYNILNIVIQKYFKQNINLFIDARIFNICPLDFFESNEIYKILTESRYIDQTILINILTNYKHNHLLHDKKIIHCCTNVILRLNYNDKLLFDCFGLEFYKNILLDDIFIYQKISSNKSIYDTDIFIYVSTLSNNYIKNIKQYIINRSDINSSDNENITNKLDNCESLYNCMKNNINNIKFNDKKIFKLTKENLINYHNEFLNALNIAIKKKYYKK